MEPTEDRILEEIKRDPDVQPRLHEMLQLEELKKHPGWQYQAARFANFRKGVAETLARRLLAGVKIDPEQLAFERGYATAVEDVFKWPERIEKSLERAAEKAYMRLQQDPSDEDGVNDPGGHSGT